MRSPTGFDHDDAAQRGQLAVATYRRLSDARIALAREFGLPDQLPFPAIGPSSRAGSFRELQDRIREEGSAAAVVCDRVISNLIAQAREEPKSIDWVAERAFTEGAWRTARAWVSRRPPQRRPSASEPIRPVDPPMTAEDRAELSALASRVARMPTAQLVQMFGSADRSIASPPDEEPIDDEESA